jgi:hypothetical protein
MADKSNRGQQKSHKVVYPDGTEGTMTQEEWRNRDKAAGIQRVDEEVEAVPETPAQPEQPTEPPA